MKTPTIIVHVHRPEISPEERARRMEHIKKAAADLVIAAKRERKDRV